MAEVIKLAKQQSLTEVRIHDVDFTNDLKDLVTIVSATATHTPPSGSASTPIVVWTDTVVSAELGPLAVTGTHYLDIFATLSDDEVSSVRLQIEVIF